MGGFVVGGGDVGEGGVETAVVVPVDLSSGGVFDVGAGGVGAVVEYRGVDAFGFAETIDVLHQCVVVGIPDASDQGEDPFEFEVFGVAY